MQSYPKKYNRQYQSHYTYSPDGITAHHELHSQFRVSKSYHGTFNIPFQDVIPPQVLQSYLALVSLETKQSHLAPKLPVCRRYKSKFYAIRQYTTDTKHLWIDQYK